MSRNLAKRPLQEICVERALVGILCRDLAISGGELGQRLGEERRGVARRSFIDSLTESCTAASMENLSTRSCPRSSTEIFTKGICRTDLASFLLTARVALATDGFRSFPPFSLEV